MDSYVTEWENRASNGLVSNTSANTGISDFLSQVAKWNQRSGVSANGDPLGLPSRLNKYTLQSDITTLTDTGNGPNALIVSENKISVNADLYIQNGVIDNDIHTRLKGYLGNSATRGVVESLSVDINPRSSGAANTNVRNHAHPNLDAISKDDHLISGKVESLPATTFDRISPVTLSNYRLPQGSYGLFVRNTSPQSRYLVETNPEFTEAERFMGSDYLLDKLDYSDDGTYKLLGDGRYESRLIRDAVMANTGQRYLTSDVSSDYEQYRYLLDNAVEAKEALSLSIGVGLTPEQTAALTHDIVWLEEQVVDGQTVLAPVLYLAQIDSRNVRGSSLIQGRDIELIAGGNLTNVGTIRATDDLSAKSKGSILQGGLVESGERLELTASNSLRNALSGEIRGGQVRLESIKEDIVNDRTAVTAGYEKAYNTYIDQGGLISARENLAMIAGRDIVNRADVESQGNASFVAGRDITNSAVEDSRRETQLNGFGTARTSTSQLRASLTASGDIALDAGRDVVVTASDVMARGALQAKAERDIRLAAGENTTRIWNQRFDSRSADQVGSRFASGDYMTLNAGRDVQLQASSVDSDAGLDIAAANEIVLNADTNRRETKALTWVRYSESSEAEQVGSALNAVGDIAIEAGRDVTALASSANAGEGMEIKAGRDLALASAENTQHEKSLTRTKKKIRQQIRQQGSELVADDGLSLSAGNDLRMVSSKVKAGEEAYLFAGNRVELLAANDQDYSLYEKEKDGGLFGSSSYRRDEVDDRRAVGSQIVGGDGLSVFSGGDQTYQGARLESGGDLALTSLGSIDFATASDLHSESHEKSSGNFAWQSSQGEGRTDETLHQSELIARGETLIRAANGLNIDVSHIDQQTVSQTIDAMVAADPDLAWLKDMQARGDVDWHTVKAIHDSWDYSQSGLGAGAALAISIAAVAIVGPAAAGYASGTFGTASAGALAANAAVGAAASSLATTATVSLINNRGDLGDAFDDTLSSESLKGALIAAASAGAAQGLDGVWGGSTDIVNGQTTGFNLSDWSDTGRFIGQRASQAVVDAGLQTAIAGGEFDEHLRQTLQGAASTVLEATLFNQVGDLGARYPELLADGEGGKIALHALAGGLAAEATGGDFRTGAAAAGANEALIKQLDTLVDRDPQLLVAASKLTGLMAAGLVDGDVAQGAEIAGNATTYNYLSHWQEAKKDEELAACKDDLLCKAGTRANWAMVDAQQEAGLLVGSAGGIALSAKEAAEGVYALVTDFPEVMDGLKQLATSPEYRQQFGENYLNDLQVRADRLNTAYETAGWDGSVTAGVEGGRFAAELAGVLTAVKGGAQLVAKLPSSAGKLIDAAKPSPSVVSGGKVGSGSLGGTVTNVANATGALKYVDEPPFNPSGSVGAAQPWSMKGRIKHVELPTQGKIRYVPPEHYTASNPLPRGPNNGYIDKFGNEWIKGPSRTAGEAFEWDVQLSKQGRAQLGWASRDGSHMNISLTGKITHK